MRKAYSIALALVPGKKTCKLFCLGFLALGWIGVIAQLITGDHWFYEPGMACLGICFLFLLGWSMWDAYYFHHLNQPKQ